MGKMGQNGLKIASFEFIGKISQFFLILPIMKVKIVCCIFAQIPYLGKIWFLRYVPKCSWPIRSQDCKSMIYLEQSDEKVGFLACWYKFVEIKSCSKTFGVGVIKILWGHPGHRTLKLADLKKELMV